VFEVAKQLGIQLKEIEAIGPKNRFKIYLGQFRAL
jgi:hypothetical protein